jgi:deoxyribodipyrimidine photo-lyase
MRRNAHRHNKSPTLILFRNDLRISDNRALAAAAGNPVVCLYVLDQSGKARRPVGGASRWWLHHSLVSLDRSLKERGASLLLRRGDETAVALETAKAIDAQAVYWNRRYEPGAVHADTQLKTTLRSKGVAAESFDGQLLHEPSRLRTGSGGAYKVFGAFERALWAEPEPRDPVDAPDRLIPFHSEIGDRLADWRLLPTRPDWSAGLTANWTPGEPAAHQRLEKFLAAGLTNYAEGRDFPFRAVPSQLSPYLTHGEITPYQILARLRQQRHSDNNSAKFRSELAWREFCYHQAFNLSDLAGVNVDRRFDAFPWRSDRTGLVGWRQGLTGYPIVDAGMRELWQTGAMHNRVRMIVASFLTKHLLVDWRQGEQWFWDTLVDADPASNPANWQWVAGCGADAAPYFRIFNPVLQGEKFDADGVYVRRFVPELAGLSPRWIHKPWQAPESELNSSGITLGETYPLPLVDHHLARERALSAYASIKGIDNKPGFSPAG